MTKERFGNKDYIPSMKLSGVCDSLGVTGKKFGDGECAVTCKISESHLNAGGVAHGGLHSTMLDSALGGALVSVIKKEEWCATTQLGVSFISAARPGEKITAFGNVVKRGKHVAHLEGKICSESGRVIATATGTWAIWDHKPASKS